MNPYVEAALLSLMSGLVSACAVVGTPAADGARDWIGAAIVLVSATAGAFGIAIRNLHRDPPNA